MGTQLDYVGFDVSGDRFANLLFGQGVCPECGHPHTGAFHPDIPVLLERGVLDSRLYTVRARFEQTHFAACDLDGDDLAELIEIMKQSLPLTAFGIQHTLAGKAAAATRAYDAGRYGDAYQVVIDSFTLVEQYILTDLLSLMRNFMLSQREGVQRFIGLPPTPTSAAYEHRDFGRYHVRDVYELQPGEKFGLATLYHDHVNIVITSDPYTICGVWAVKFRFTDSAYAPLGEQSRFLCELGMAPYPDGKWSTNRYLVVLPESR